MMIKDILLLLKSNKKVLIILPLLFGLVVGIYAFVFMPNEYTSKLAVYVLEKTNEAYLPEASYLRGSFVESYNEMLAAQHLANDLAQMAQTDKVRDYVTSELGEDSLADYRIDIESSEKHRIITFMVTHTDPKKATDAVSALTYKVSELAKETTLFEHVTVIDDPKVPESPSGPQRLIISALAVAIGLFIAFVIVFIKDAVNRRVGSAEDVVNNFDLKILAQVPKV